MGTWSGPRHERRCITLWSQPVPMATMTYICSRTLEVVRTEALVKLSCIFGGGGLLRKLQVKEVLPRHPVRVPYGVVR